MQPFGGQSCPNCTCAERLHHLHTLWLSDGRRAAGFRKRPFARRSAGLTDHICQGNISHHETGVVSEGERLNIILVGAVSADASIRQRRLVR